MVEKLTGQYISDKEPTITIANGRVVMMVPKPLKSLNKRGGFWAEHQERRAWEKIIKECGVVSDGSVTLPVSERRRLEVVRLAPSRRYLLDKTNLDACAKRLEDALVALGYLVNDDRFGVEGPFITQGVSSDKCYWALVTISAAQAYVDDIHILNPQDLAAEARAQAA